MSKSWIFILIGLITTLLSNLFYAYIELSNLQLGFLTNLKDFGWISLYFLFFLGAYYQRMVLKGNV
jgi:hypothetical protein